PPSWAGWTGHPRPSRHARRTTHPPPTGAIRRASTGATNPCTLPSRPTPAWWATATAPTTPFASPGASSCGPPAGNWCKSQPAASAQGQVHPDGAALLAKGERPVVPRQDLQVAGGEGRDREEKQHSEPGPFARNGGERAHTAVLDPGLARPGPPTHPSARVGRQGRRITRRQGRPREER